MTPHRDDQRLAGTPEDGMPGTEMTPLAFFRHVLTRKPVLWQAMLAFNAMGGLKAAVSERTELADDDDAVPRSLRAVPGLPEESARRLWRSAAVRRRWGRLPADAGVAPDGGGFWDFSEESRRLALLDQRTLHRLTLVFGAAIHAECLAGVVLKAEVQALRTRLGRDLPEYALHRGRFQVAASPALFTGRNPELPLDRRIRLHGLQALGSLRAFWPEALRRRSPFPACGDAPPDPLPLNARQRGALWRDMKKILLKEVAPAWTPCFD